MTMSSAVSKVTLNGDGVQTSWPFAFKVWKAADLEISITNAEGVTTVVSNWSASLAGQGGTVTYPTSGSPLPSGHKITIARSMDFLQDVDLVSGTRWDPEVVETALDIACAERQQLKEKLARAVTVDIASGTTPEALRDSIFSARDTAVSSAASALDSAERAEIASSTVAYYNHEGTLLTGEDTISLPWAYDTEVGVEVFLGGVKQAESSLTFTDAYTVTLDAPVAADTPFEVVASSGARSDLSNTLAGSGGSSLVGFLQDGTGASARTVQAKLRDVVSVKDFGAVGDGVTDDTAAIQAALDKSLNVFIPSGIYKITDTIFIQSGGRLTGAGRSRVTIDASSAEPSAFHGQQVVHIGVGSASVNYASLPGLGAEVRRGDTVVTFTSAHGLAKGDVFCVVDPTESSLSGYRTYYKKGQIHQVDSVESTTVVKTCAPFKFNIEVANAVAYKNTATRGSGISGITLNCWPSEDTLTIGVCFASEVGCYVKDVEINGPHYIGIEFTEGVYDFVVDNCTVLCTADSAPNDETYQYGVKAGISAVGRITNNYIVAGRHAVDGGSGAATLQLCTTDIVVANNITHSTWGASLSAHGSCLDWIFSDNIATGVILRGGGHIVTGNSFTVRRDSEDQLAVPPITIAELFDPNLVICNNQATAFDSTLNKGAFVDCQGLDVNTVIDKGAISITNNTFRLKSNTSGTPVQGIFFSNAGAVSISLSLIIKDNIFYSEHTNIYTALRVRKTLGDNIWVVDMRDNACVGFGVCYIIDSKHCVIKNNTSNVAQDIGIRVEAESADIVANTLRDCADAGIYSSCTNYVSVKDNEITGYHLTDTGPASITRGAIAITVAAGGNIYLKGNIVSGAGASAPTWTYQVFSSGVPAVVYVSDNFDADAKSFRNSAGLTLKGGEGLSYSLMDGVTRNVLTAPGGVLKLNGVNV